MKLKEMMKIVDVKCMRQIWAYEYGVDDCTETVLRAGIEYPGSEPFGEYEVTAIYACRNPECGGPKEIKEGDEEIIVLTVAPPKRRSASGKNKDK